MWNHSFKVEKKNKNKKTEEALTYLEEYRKKKKNKTKHT